MPAEYVVEVRQQGLLAAFSATVGTTEVRTSAILRSRGTSVTWQARADMARWTVEHVGR